MDGNRAKINAKRDLQIPSSMDSKFSLFNYISPISSLYAKSFISIV